MEFKYTEDQIALRRAVREWAQSYLAPKAEEIDVNNRFPTETIEALGEQDLMGLAYPEELGGAGWSFPPRPDGACPGTPRTWHPLRRPVRRWSGQSHRDRPPRRSGRWF